MFSAFLGEIKNGVPYTRKKVVMEICDQHSLLTGTKHRETIVRPGMITVCHTGQGSSLAAIIARRDSVVA